MQATEVVISALVAVENSQPEVARLLLDTAAAIVQAGQVRVHTIEPWLPCGDQGIAITECWLAGWLADSPCSFLGRAGSGGH
jgi:hypothetical protein